MKFAGTIRTKDNKASWNEIHRWCLENKCDELYNQAYGNEFAILNRTWPIYSHVLWQVKEAADEEL